MHFQALSKGRRDTHGHAARRATGSRPSRPRECEERAIERVAALRARIRLVGEDQRGERGVAIDRVERVHDDAVLR